MQVFLTPTHLAIAMEYAKGGNLFHYLLQHGPHCRLNEAKAQWIFQQLIIGLDYCHRRVSICCTLCCHGKKCQSPEVASRASHGSSYLFYKADPFLPAVHLRFDVGADHETRIKLFHSVLLTECNVLMGRGALHMLIRYQTLSTSQVAIS